MAKHHWAAIGTAGVVLSGGILLLSNYAMAAGGGYAPPPAPPTTTSVPGGYTSVVAAKTITTSGGNFAVAVDGVATSVKVPAGAFSGPVVVTVTAPQLNSVSSALASAGFSGYKAVAGLGITFQNTSNQFVNPSIPVSVTVKQSGITSSDKVIEWTGSHSAQTVASTLSSGSATFAVTQGDPDYAVLSSTTVPQATSPVTGVPMERWGIAGLGLLLAGGALLRFRSGHVQG